MVRTATSTQWWHSVRARLTQALGSFQQWEREPSRSFELERGICRTPRREVGGQCLILIKRARLIVSTDPVCHSRYAEGSLWPRPTYGPACCSPIQPPPAPCTCSAHLDWFPGPCLPGEWGLLSLFSQPLSPQTGFLIFKPAWAIERGCVIQRDLKREREGLGLERTERGCRGREKFKHQRWECKTLQTATGRGLHREI